LHVGYEYNAKIIIEFPQKGWRLRSLNYVIKKMR